MANITNSITGENYMAETIVSTKTGGLLVKGDKLGNFTYVPNNEIVSTPAENTVSVNGPQKSLSYGSRIDSIENQNQEIVKQVVYDFGIDSVVARYTSPKPISGFVSSQINIGACSYITLSVKTSGKLDGRMEFSIIDGSTETPILPEEMEKQVLQEKLFPGMQTRFSMNTEESYTIYKDGAASSLTYEQVLAMPLDDGEYSISYISNGEYKYIPVNEQIRLKVIARCTDNKPVPIKAMTIKKFGGEMPWHISD